MNTKFFSALSFLIIFLCISCNPKKEEQNCLTPSESQFIEELTSKFNSTIAAAYGTNNFRDFIEDMSQNSLSNDFFTESYVYEYLVEARNSAFINSIWNSTETGYAFNPNSKFFSCILASTNSRDLLDILKTVEEVPDASFEIVAVSILEFVPESVDDSFSLRTFAALYFFSQNALNLSIDNSELYDSFTEEEVMTEVEEPPTYPGGITKFYEYLKQNIRYPREARINGVEGNVYVQFVVDQYGNIRNVEVVKGIGSGCDLEAERVLKSVPKFNPGYHKGKPVPVRMVLPVMFRFVENT